MRRAAWLVTMTVALTLALPAGPAAAQVTEPDPDFNGDGFGDLAVGAPGEGVGTAAAAGAVSVLYGSGGGMAGDGQVLTQASPGVPGTAETADHFGAALVAGRFDGDQFWDLAVGAPGEDVGATDAGAVTVLFGSAGGLGGARARLLTQANPEARDSFGFSLDFGQVTGGGELLVGAPGEDVGRAASAGAVSIIANPGSTPDEDLLYQGKPGVAGTAESGDAFGWAVAANDYNDAAGQDSLAMGAPGEDIGSVADAGVVVVLYAPGFGGADGLRVLTQDRPETGDRFGSALADGFLAGNDGTVDLAVGAPGERVGSAAGAGAVSVVKNDSSGFLSTGSQLFHQGASGVPGTAEAGDGFGTAVAVGSFGEDAGGLAVGAPGEDVGPVADAGALAVLYGLDGTNTELLTQADAGGAVEAGDGFGAALSAPFFHENDVLADLGVGAPGETVGGRVAAGAGSVLFGAVSGGLGGAGGQFFHQGVSGLGGTAETGDVFGAAFATQL